VATKVFVKKIDKIFLTKTFVVTSKLTKVFVN
jgi:hypothetical protein